MGQTAIRLHCNLVAVAFAAFAFGSGVAAAGAQESPTVPPASVASTPLDLTTTNIAATSDGKRAEAARGSVITIDASISDQFPLGADQRVKPGNTNDQVVFGGTVLWHLYPQLAVYFRRVNHDNVSGATNGTGFGSWSYDIEGNFGIQYIPSRNLRIESFWKYRYRSCCPGAADATAFPTNAKTPVGPRAERGVMTNVTWRFGPNTRIGPSFLISEEAQAYVHRLDYTITSDPNFIKAGNTIAGQPIGPSSKVLWETHVYYYMSIYGQTRVIPYIGYENKPSYFDNNLQPSFQNRVRFGTLIRLSPMFSLDTYVKNDHSYPASPSASHNTTLFTDFLIHLRS
jgi:hypothetical protein